MFLKIEIENLQTRRSHIKATLMYTILNDQSPTPPPPPPQLTASFTTLNDSNTNITIIFAILKLIYYIQGQKLISSNAVLSVVLQCSGTIFLTRKKQHDHSLNLKAKVVFAFCYNALIFKFVCVISSLKLIVHLLILQNSYQQT